MKLSLFLLLTLAPLTVHAQAGMEIIPVGDDSANTPPAATSPSVEVKFVGTASDTTLYVTTDSAVKILKATRTRVVFMDSLRSTRKALLKLDPHRIVSIQIEKGDLVVNQYGLAAKNGVLTVRTKPLLASAPGSIDVSGGVMEILPVSGNPASDSSATKTK